MDNDEADRFGGDVTSQQSGDRIRLVAPSMPINMPQGIRVRYWGTPRESVRVIPNCGLSPQRIIALQCTRAGRDIGMNRKMRHIATGADSDSNGTCPTLDRDEVTVDASQADGSPSTHLGGDGSAG